MTTPQNWDNDTAAFFRHIFEPEGELFGGMGWLAIWNKASKKTRLFDSADDAARYAALPENEDVSYFGVALRDRALLKRRAVQNAESLENIQGTKVECSAMPGIWADIDIASSGHKKTKRGLPPTLEDAYAALERAIPLKPTIVVETGGGIHAYWLYDEGVTEFKAGGQSGSREEHEMLCRSFQAMLRDEFAKSGWVVDQTWALTRVMRVPGQTNRSHGEPRPTRWQVSARRFSMEELWEVVPGDLELSEPEKANKHENGKDFSFVLRDITENFAGKVERWVQDRCAIDDDLELVWERKRKDLPSQSEIDLSLSTRLAAMGATPQEAVDAMRVHRYLKDGNVAKLSRSTYYLDRVSLAWGALKEEREKQEFLAKARDLHNQIKAGRVEGAAPPPEGEVEAEHNVVSRDQITEIKTQALALINKMIGADHESYIKEIFTEEDHTAGQTRAVFKFSNGSIKTCKFGQLINDCKALRSAVAEALRIYVPAFSLKPKSKRYWPDMFEAILAAAIEVEEHGDVSQVIEALGRLVYRRATSHFPMHAYGTEAWHLAAARRDDVLLWGTTEPETGKGRPRDVKWGVLVMLRAWRGHVEDWTDVSGPSIAPVTRSALHAMSGSVRRHRIAYKGAQGRTERTRDYLLVSPPALKELGRLSNLDVAGAVKRAFTDAIADPAYDEPAAGSSRKPEEDRDAG